MLRRDFVKGGLALGVLGLAVKVKGVESKKRVTLIVLGEYNYLIGLEKEYLLIEGLTQDQIEWFETDNISFYEDDVPKVCESMEECPEGDIRGYVFGYHLEQYHNGNFTRCTFEEGQDIYESEIDFP